MTAPDFSEAAKAYAQNIADEIDGNIDYRCYRDYLAGAAHGWRAGIEAAASMAEADAQFYREQYSMHEKIACLNLAEKIRALLEAKAETGEK